MKKVVDPSLQAVHIEALEARFALRVSARLNESAATLPHDISERLRVAREQAIRAAHIPQNKTALAPQRAPSRLVTAVSVAGTASGLHQLERDHSHGRRLDDGPLPWGWRLASALPALTLALGLWGIHHWHLSEQVQAATEVDMALLTDDLPPSAYADPGFEEYLRSDLASTQTDALP